MNADSKH